VNGPYAELAACARRQQELTAEGRFDELAEATAQAERLLGALPETPPAEAVPCLAAVQEALTSSIALLEARLSSVREELRKAATERRMRERYGAEPGTATIDAHA
jgi:hypothetical protein